MTRSTAPLAIALVLEALLLAAGRGPPRADAEPPSHVELDLVRRVAQGPRTDDATRVVAWAHETAALGRARRGTRLGGDLLGAAAGALSSRDLAPDLALALWREAMAAYPPRHPRAAEGWLEIARIEHERGRHAEALAALDELERAAREPAPAGEATPEALDRRRLGALVVGLGTDLRIAAERDLGRDDDAAERDERRAAALEASDPERAASRWAAAADAAWRAGDAERALDDARRALALSHDDALVVSRTIWSLHARLGWLDRTGGFRPRADAWEAPSTLDDVRAALGSLAGRRGAWREAVRLATLAALSGRDREALALFDVAFRDSEFAAAARDDEVDRTALAVAAQAAWRLGEDALALGYLDTADALAGATVASALDLRRRIEERLDPGRIPSDAPPLPGRREASAGVPAPPPSSPTSGTQAGTPPDTNRRAEPSSEAPRDGAWAPAWALAAIALGAAGLAACAVAARAGRAPRERAGR